MSNSQSCETGFTKNLKSMHSGNKEAEICLSIILGHFDLASKTFSVTFPLIHTSTQFRIFQPASAGYTIPLVLRHEKYIGYVELYPHPRCGLSRVTSD